MSKATIEIEIERVEGQTYLVVVGREGLLASVGVAAGSNLWGEGSPEDIVKRLLLPAVAAIKGQLA